MHLCFTHFWDWNMHSLRRRGLHAIAEMLKEHLDRGFFDEAPGAVMPSQRSWDRRFFD